jgi:hypothetical protein
VVPLRWNFWHTNKPTPAIHAASQQLHARWSSGGSFVLNRTDERSEYGSASAGCNCLRDNTNLSKQHDRAATLDLDQLC